MAMTDKYMTNRTMTNKEDEGSASCEPRLAALLAVHLVGQVLEEAYVIANAATETGRPWRYLDMIKRIRSGQLGDVEEQDVSICTPKPEGDDGRHCSEDGGSNHVVTSTPQKTATDQITKVMNDNNFIGQGDEDNEMRQNELTQSTSMFINHLFDMSEVEHVIICNETETIQKDSNDSLTEAMTKIMESYVNTALETASGPEVPIVESRTGERSPSTENSGYSFLDDASEMGNDLAFCVDHDATNNRKEFGSTSVVVTEIPEQAIIDVVKEDNNKKDEVAFYENTYLTLNRDYDQCSDDDGDPVLQDTKGLSMHEVELMTVRTSGENSPRVEGPLKFQKKELAATSAVSASATGSQRSGLVQRCRTQGARLLACLRGWWRRKTPGKRKEARVPGSVRGLCPLSPDARRRAASLLDHRRLCSSPLSQHAGWKFNTVSEALVNSSRWKNYTFDVIPDECGEY